VRVNNILETVLPLKEIGFALHWLHPKTKKPIGEGWGSAPVATIDQLRKSYRPGNNVGVRLGEYSEIDGLYWHAIDMDIRRPEYEEEAHAALAAFYPEWRRLGRSISGSRGASRHLFYFSDKPFRFKPLAKSEGTFEEWDAELGRTVTHNFWEIERFGTGKQVALAPSIHPKSGLEYEWENPIDFDLIEMGCSPCFIPSEIVESWRGPDKAARAEPTEDNYLLAMLREDSVPKEIDELRAYLDDLPKEYLEHYPEWISTGMAIHHQFKGSEEGFKFWCDYSKQSTKYDESYLRYQWDKSFEAHPDGVTFRSLIGVANIVRAGRDLDEIEEDIIGMEPTKAELAELAASEKVATPEPEKPAAPDMPDIPWRMKLDRGPVPEGSKDEKGAIKQTLPNYRLIVANDPRTRGVAAMNKFTSEVVQKGKPGKRKQVGVVLPTIQLTEHFWQIDDPVNGDMWTTSQDMSVRSFIETATLQGGWATKVTDRDLRAAIHLAAEDNPFHPIKDYIEGLHYKGGKLLETMFIRHLGADDNAYTRQTATLMMVAAIARIYKPGQKFDYAVILEGLQGKRKSTYIEVLAAGWFKELQGDFHNGKEMVEGMQGGWLIEMPELSQFGRSDVESIKAFISRKTDTVRLAYERRAANFDRQCIFIGSTNNYNYLRDDSGGRRFWPMPCNVPFIDTDAVASELDQLWAEAYQVYLKMRSETPAHCDLVLTLDAEANAIALGMQESRRVQNEGDIFAAKIAEWLETPFELGDDDLMQGKMVLRDRVCGVEAWCEALGNREQDYAERSNHHRVTKAMEKLKGWKRCDSGPLKHKSYGKQRLWERIPVTE
jgi:predicted P-loop ATPase